MMLWRKGLDDGKKVLGMFCVVSTDKKGRSWKETVGVKSIFILVKFR